MTTPINDGGPAFPHSTPLGISSGMTLRDYFAAKALQSLVGKLSQDEIDEKGALLTHKMLAEVSYQLADAMIEQRNAELRHGGEHE